MAKPRHTNQPARRSLLQVAVSGGRRCSTAVSRTAAALGAALADAGAIVICGGLTGVMNAVARGATEHGGIVVGVLPEYDRATANPHVTVALPTGLGYGRNILVAAAGDVLVALPGGPGTLSEVSFALVLGRPVVGLGAWGNVAGVHEVERVADAVALVARLARGRRDSGRC
jgi:uncharacterized protein (TIGR00725 family)